MSVNRAQMASPETLSFEDALDTLFNEILNYLVKIDLFSTSIQPVIFPVYAHDNPAAGTAHACCVIQIIKWLEAAGCRAISDRNPLLPYSSQGDNSAAIRNILSNQSCLLPRGLGQQQAANERIHADKALVFCSEVLRHYCTNASAREYLVTIEDVYMECRGKPRDHLEQRLRLTIEEKARNGGAWFHHVLTEIAFLKVRKDLDRRDHGIIPVALDGELPDYLPFSGPTDLVLKRESVSLYKSDLHKTFFKILLQIYPNLRSSIEKSKDCYMTLKNVWASSGGTVARDTFNDAVVKCTLEVRNYILQQAPIATRHRLRDMDIDQVAEQIQGRSIGDTAEELARKRRFLKTLATVPYGDRKDRNPERDEGTCLWFKNHSKFQEWQESKGASLLWVSADPGCGKSVLAKYLVDDVLLTADEQMTCYFFFKDDYADQRTLESALRCLLHQVFQHNLSLLDEKLLARLEGDSQLLHSRTDLWKILTDCIQNQPVGRFVFILDGFDECSADDRSFLMKNLQKLFMNAAAPPIKLLLTSRPYEDIARGLRKLQNKELIIHLKGESEQELYEISQEIDIVIENNVDDLGEDLELEPDVIELIKIELTKLENRTYLWVSLMMDILKNAIQTSKDAIRTLLTQQLPRSVSAAYEKILRREQNDETNAKTRRLLHLIMAANEPLTAGEIAVAFSMSERAPFHEEALSRDTKFIREFSRLLIVVRNEKLYFAHQTVKEFLIMDSAEPPRTALLGPFSQWTHSFHPHHSHCVMAESCMNYLERHISGEDVFLYYAAINWSDHLRESGDVDKIMVIQSRNLCDSSSTQFRTWFEIYWMMVHSTNFDDCMAPTYPTSLIVASMVGLKVIVELLLQTQKDLKTEDNAFFWAWHGSHFDVAELLLDWVSKSNADILNRITYSTDWYGNTLLHDAIYAIKRSYPNSNQEARIENIIRLLLNNGACTNTKNKRDDAPLHIAYDCSEAVVKLLLESGADPTLKALQGDTALHLAVRSGNLATAKLFLENRADCKINSWNNDRMTPLLLSIENRNLDMVELLLDHEADVNFESGVWAWDHDNEEMTVIKIKTPLAYATECRVNGEIPELLVKRGANIEVASPEWENLLIYAVWRGNMEVIKILLDRGGHLNFIWYDCPDDHSDLYLAHGLGYYLDDDLDGPLTPLLAALKTDKKEMIERLLHHGADVNYPLPEENPSISREITRLMRIYRKNNSYEGEE